MDQKETGPVLPDPETERLQKRYHALFPEDMTPEQIRETLNGMRGDPDLDALREMFCNGLLYVYCAGYAEYPKKDKDIYAEMKRLFLEQAVLLPKQEYAFFHAAACFFRGEHGGCIRDLKRFFDRMRSFWTQQPLDESAFADCFVDVFKNAYPGFWSKIAQLLRNYPCEADLTELCETLEAYYRCQTDEDRAELLLPFAAAHPAFSLPKELLGFAYMGLKLWGNALACFEQVEEKSVLFYYGDVRFWMAWCCGKLRDRKAEEQYYRDCLKADPDYPNAVNNLGDCLYRQKRYEEAIGLLGDCVREERDLPWAANNYVRALLAAGKNETARAFVRETGISIRPELIKRVKNAPKKDLAAPAEPLPEEEDPDADTPLRLPDTGVKQQQFSSEKTLEDELSARLLAGREVFGKKLRLYRRRGDWCGRQYPINGGKGRIDLLCVDETGDFYVIELKKDAGYDDPYIQIRDYVEWVHKHLCPKNRKTYGIICLNSPSQALREAVRRDDRIELYEYSISYSRVV